MNFQIFLGVLGITCHPEYGRFSVRALFSYKLVSFRVPSTLKSHQWILSQSRYGWVILHISVSFVAYKINICVTAKIALIGAIGCLCRCGSPKCLVKLCSWNPWTQMTGGTQSCVHSNIWGFAQVILTERLEFWGHCGLKEYPHPPCHVPLHVPFHSFSHWTSGDAWTPRGTRKHAWQCLWFLLGREGVRWNSGDSRHDVFHFPHSLTASRVRRRQWHLIFSIHQMLVHLTPFPPPHVHICTLLFAFSLW